MPADEHLIGLELNLPHVVAEVTEVFDRYEQALLDNDVEVLDELFWHHPGTVRFGIDEELFGFEAISAYRRTQAQATPIRTLRNTVIRTFGEHLATADTEFVPRDFPVLGRQSQTWARTTNGWRVVSAHVSWHSGIRPGQSPT